MDLRSWMLAFFVPMAYMGSQYYSETQTVNLPKPKVTNLHFYLHELRGTGPNATAVIVAQDKDTTMAVSVIDDILRVGPEEDSKIIGDAKGLSVPPTKPGAPIVGVLFLEFGFTEGKLKGSSFSVFSRNPLTDPVRELSVVGGRGQFKMANGFALIRNTFFSETKFIVEYKVTLVHY